MNRDELLAGTAERALMSQSESWPLDDFLAIAQAAAAPRDEPAGGISVNVGGVFMEDFDNGTPWSLVSGFHGTDQTYVAKDGSGQIISFPFNVERAISRLYPSPNNLAAWGLQKVPFPPDSFCAWLRRATKSASTAASRARRSRSPWS